MDRIEFIIPTYNRPWHLMAILGSIFAQDSDLWRVHVVADAVYEGYERVKNYFQGDERIRFSELQGPHNDGGHTPRNYGLSEAVEEWVVMSGDDNYYMPIFVREFLGVACPETKFVYCDLVHNWVNQQYLYLISNPRVWGMIDIGNFMTRTNLAKQLRLGKRFDADFWFVQKYLNHFKGKIKRVGKPLYVHN